MLAPVCNKTKEEEGVHEASGTPNFPSKQIKRENHTVCKPDRSPETRLYLLVKKHYGWNKSKTLLVGGEGLRNCFD